MNVYGSYDASSKKDEGLSKWASERAVRRFTRPALISMPGRIRGLRQGEGL